MTESVETVNFDGIFGAIQIKHRPKFKSVDMSKCNTDKLPGGVTVEQILQTNECDVEGYVPECYVAIQNILSEDEGLVDGGGKDAILVGVSSEGATRLEALQNLYKLLAETHATQDISRLK